MVHKSVSKSLMAECFEIFSDVHFYNLKFLFPSMILLICKPFSNHCPETNMVSKDPILATIVSILATFGPNSGMAEIRSRPMPLYT